MKNFTPELNEIYKLSELENAYGHLESFALWDKLKRQVGAFTLNPSMNPSIKDQEKSETLKILVAKGPLRESILKRLLLNRPYPVFVKIKTNQWKFIGIYNFCGFTKNRAEIVPHLKNLEEQLDDIVCVITLEKEAVYQIQANESKKAA